MKLLKENKDNEGNMSMWESDYNDLYEPENLNIVELKNKLYEAIDKVLEDFKSNPNLNDNINNNINIKNNINKEQPKPIFDNIQWWGESQNKDSTPKNNVDLYTDDMNVDDEM